MRTRLLLLSLLAVALGSIAAACGGGDGPSVRAEPTDSSSTTSTSAPAPDSTTTTGAPTTTAPPAPGVVRYGGLQFTVPKDWPVHDLAAEPATCARVDQHAVYLGEEGADASCPSRIVGTTETLQLEPIDTRSQLAADRATQSSTINGLPVRVDPTPELDGALTVVFTDQHIVAVLTYGTARPTVDQILASVSAA